MPFGRAVRVLFICDGNVCRGPLAEHLLRSELLSYGITDREISVASAGLTGRVGARMDELCEQVLSEYGLDGSSHRACQISNQDVAEADLILAMTRDQRDSFAASYPLALSKVFVFSGFVRLLKLLSPEGPIHEQPLKLSQKRSWTSLSPEDNIEDPYKQDEQTHRRVGDVLQRLARELAQEWAPAMPATCNNAGSSLPQQVVALDCFGVRVDVVCHAEDVARLARTVELAWKWCLAGDRSDEPAEKSLQVLLSEDESELAEFRKSGWLAYPSDVEIMHYLSSAVTSCAIEARAGQFIMLHAAGVALPDGRVVGFVAESGTGKTTLSRTLCTTYGYVTDETLVITRNGDVLPYPKPLSIIHDPSTHIKQQLSPAQLGLVRPPKTLQIEGLVLLSRDPLAGDAPYLESTKTLHAASWLAEQMSYAPKMDKPVQTIVEMIEYLGGFPRVVYREASSLNQIVPQLAER